MKLPGRESASIERRKVLEYLLSLDNPDGRSKARFFIRVGFDPADWLAFADARREHAFAHEVCAVNDSRHGTRYIADGPLETPSGRRPLVRTVWIIEHGTRAPRLVSAYPLKERRQ
jgi:hypothetical protein